MLPKVVITQRTGHSPPVFEGRCNDEPIVIHLDTSAMLRLSGDESFEGISPLSSGKVNSIERAAERLVAARQVEMGANLSVSISALDLE